MASMWNASKDYEKAVEASGQTLLDAANDLWTLVSKIPEEALGLSNIHPADRWWFRHNSNATVEEVLAWCEASVFATDFAWLHERVGDRDHAGRGKALAALMINYLTHPTRTVRSDRARALNAETAIYLVFEGVFTAPTREEEAKRQAYFEQRQREAAEQRQAATAAETASIVD